MPGAQKVLAAVLEDKIRLIRGQSIVNVAVLIGAIENLQRKNERKHIRPEKKKNCHMQGWNRVYI